MPRGYLEPLKRTHIRITLGEVPETEVQKFRGGCQPPLVFYTSVVTEVTFFTEGAGIKTNGFG